MLLLAMMNNLFFVYFVLLVSKPFVNSEFMEAWQLECRNTDTMQECRHMYIIRNSVSNPGPLLMSMVEWSHENYLHCGTTGKSLTTFIITRASVDVMSTCIRTMRRRIPRTA